MCPSYNCFRLHICPSFLEYEKPYRTRLARQPINPSSLISADSSGGLLSCRYNSHQFFQRTDFHRKQSEFLIIGAEPRVFSGTSFRQVGVQVHCGYIKIQRACKFHLFLWVILLFYCFSAFNALGWHTLVACTTFNNFFLIIVKN